MSERAYFDPPSVDRVLTLVMQLAEDLHVTRHRVRVLEQLLVDRGAIEPGAVAGFTPDEAQAAVLDAERDAYLARLLRVMAEHGPSEHPLRGEVQTGATT